MELRTNVGDRGSPAGEFTGRPCDKSLLGVKRSLPRAPILRRYLQVAPGARPHIPLDRRAPLAEFERIAALYPVFRVDADSLEANDSASPTRSR